MKSHFRKTNHPAVMGFLLPFAAAAVTGLLVLLVREDFRSGRFLLPFLTVIPSILLAGLLLSLKSIPLIEEQDDRDYAYSGLTLNILFLLIYGICVVYFFLV